MPVGRRPAARARLCRSAAGARRGCQSDRRGQPEMRHGVGHRLCRPVGQQFWSDRNVDWPRGEPLANYTRTMNWEARTMKEEFDRKPGMNPASWKYGSGWVGGTPLQRQSRQTFMVNGNYAWHLDGPGSAPIPASPDDAERWQLDLWINPHGFLKAARLPGANPVAGWRWEAGGMGRDGPRNGPEKDSGR